ncbi:Pdx1p KNAG_0G00860 [Huiozyma naganishii CBS 8797]|uniref:Lipoyl-binding domain-containing protein n=1 Tax=Huiozyma naganishii (strain ATCC MYA-139 / BCRC 22969 / CBS 8797 / KCTC 17520 / NBRC 10181 / NCYC 3082 / Yp74L-3) TaxID=1071383 RepID=J7S0T0_HUIN7|nr:hypothetical protein KNAG_0G00860 [Kazachstania naganishii CBS 8797]CCK71142.1 hypothetical protein KNAG_0G00860 [Kazachstania naganishii CBS 8797]
MWRALTRNSVSAINAGTLRYLHVTGRLWNAQPFLMPAMSPTMEKGGIVSWKFKPGDSFKSGDVLLEVETDKAQIDVEAQDDGQMAKILVDDGAKDIAVGTPIAYLAEMEDDLSKLEYPEFNANVEHSGGESSPPQESSEKGSSLRGDAAPPTGSTKETSKDDTLLPSVGILLKENGISPTDALKSISGSGPNGRILKGDVLAHLGKIPKESVSKIQDYISKNSKLDLTGIKMRSSETVTNEGSAAVKGESSAPPSKTPVPKPENITIAEDIVITPRAGVDSFKLEGVVRSYMNEAYHYTHELPVSNTQSDFFDPVFEDLITQDPRSARFSFEYALSPLTGDGAGAREDIFDVLKRSSAREDKDPVANRKESDYVLSVKIVTDGKYDDAKCKAERFLEYVRQLESL